MKQYLWTSRNIPCNGNNILYEVNIGNINIQTYKRLIPRSNQYGVHWGTSWIPLDIRKEFSVIPTKNKAEIVLPYFSVHRPFFQLHSSLAR
jgi:hypothetical protein